MDGGRQRICCFPDSSPSVLVEAGRGWDAGLVSHFTRGQECIQLRLPHPDAPLAYAYRAHFAPIDHIADRLLVEPQHLGDLGDGQELIWHGLNLIEYKG